MKKTLDELVRERPVDRTQVDAHKRRMLDELRAYRLRELREASELTQSRSNSATSASKSRDVVCPPCVPVKQMMLCLVVPGVCRSPESRA